jgi:excinuclease UvrABC nuclease subunit
MVELKKNEIADIPAKTGYYYLSDAEKILFSGKTSNLKNSIQKLISADKDDKNIFQLVSLTQKIAYQETDSLFLALLEEKKLQYQHNPEFNHTILFHDNYVYLAIDFYNVPFLKTVESTQEKFYYLGPFQNRFFVYDFIDAMATLFQFPACEDEKFPCEKLKEEKCSGWCIKDKPEIFEMLLESYLQSKRSLLKRAKSKLKKMMSNLEFLESEKLKEQIQQIEKYYDFLQFFHITKQLDTTLSYDNKTVSISNGLLSTIEENSKIWQFDNFQPEYRNNEFLAHDKSQFAERLIIYRHLKKNKLDLIEDLYKKSILKMKRNLE